MARDHQQPSRRKHQHNSDDESEEPSKRHKHRHRLHNRRHRHYHSQKLQLEDEVKQETDTEEISQHLPPPLLAVVSNGNSRTDYDMEEGEILDDDEGFDIENKKLDSHEIMNGVGVAFDGASLSLGDENDKVGSGSMILLEDNCDDNIKGNSKVDGKDNITVDTKENVNGDISKKDNNQSSLSPSPEGLAKGKGYSNGESEFRGQSKSLPSETAGKKHKSLGSLPSHERLREEDRSKSTSRSHDRARERSRSRSIVQDARDTAYHTDRKHSRDLEFESISRHHRDYPIGSWDSSREKERERSSSYGRHSVRVDRHQSLEYRDRDRERGREKERERERRRERERDRNSCYCSYDDVNVGYGDHDRHNDYRYQRLDETEHRDRSRKSDAVKAHRSKSDHSASGTEKLQRDEVEQEDYQERIVLQLAEQEEEDLNRIKEESRKRRQAILEKYKTLQPKPKAETNLEETVKESAEQPSDAAETCSDQNEAADLSLTDTPLSIGKSSERDEPLVSKISGTGELGRGTPKSERLDDMFCDDIFGDSPAGVRKQGRVDGLTIEKNGLHDNWDDAEGYYSYRFGEVLDGRYEVVAAHGKGVYSNVVRAKDLKAGPGNLEEVAIKIIRSNDIMYKAGLEELIILKKLVGADPEDRRHCVRLLSSFKYRNHLCLVFESLHMNVREVLKKFGRNIGLKLTAVRTYAQQLFIALKHLRNCGVLHSDIKPDNMLVNEAKNVLKLSDFGNAMFAGKNEITPYLVSRFYRAPEIILGLAYDHPMDIWSVGCSLFELYSGRVLFPGPSNNDMLRLHMELKGPFPKKILRKGAFTDQHFDQDLNFLATEEDPVTKKAIKRLIPNIKPKDIGTIVSGSTGENPKMLAYFKDLLEKIFMLDPDKRITVSQALSHPFITGINLLLDTVPAEDVWLGDLFLGGSFSGLCSIDIRQCYEVLPFCSFDALKALWRRVAPA